MTREPLRLVVVAGPTASGKTALGVALAEALDTEVISADSMQVYRGMEIGTGAPTAGERARVRHHFVGTLDPGTQFSAGAFGEAARRVVDALNARGRLAVAVGGSGLYIQALVDGLFDGPARDETIRARLQDEAVRCGVAALYERLRSADPGYAAAILPGDLRRIVRALEVHEVTGEPLGRLHAAHRAAMEPLPALQVALDWPRDALYERINRRVDAMLAAGFEDEVRRLKSHGYWPRLRELRTLGYREIGDCLDGRLPYEVAVEAMKRNTRRFAKRQLGWFRGDPRIRWLPMDGHRLPEALANDVLRRVAARG